MRTVVVVSGPVNAGKTTIGRALARAIEGAIFIDGDDHDAPDDAPLHVRIEAALQRLCGEIVANSAIYLVIAYPLRDEDYARLLRAAKTGEARLLVVTLSPPLEVTLSDRGNRKLDDGERERIRKMYAEGYHQPAYSDLTVAGAPSTDLAVGQILAWFGTPPTEP